MYLYLLLSCTSCEEQHPPPHLTQETSRSAVLCSPQAGGFRDQEYGIFELVATRATHHPQQEGSTKVARHRYHTGIACQISVTIYEH